MKGERCSTPKCAIERRRRSTRGRAAGRGRRSTLSEWGVRLREKQKAKYIYGVLERQFRRYFEEALKRPGVTGQYLLQLLERRLDNVVYRLNFGDSRRQGRQLVGHGHVVVNGRKVNLPSYSVRVGDVVGWKEGSKGRDFFKVRTEGIPSRPVPSWLTLDSEAMAGRVIGLPQVADLDMELDTNMIVEFYSR